MYGFCGACGAEFGAHVFDVGSGDFVEFHAAEVFVDSVAFGFIGFADSWFEVAAGLFEPSFAPCGECGDVGEGLGAFALHGVEFVLEFVSGCGFGGACGFYPSSFAGAGVGGDLFAGVVFAVVVAPFAS